MKTHITLLAKLSLLVAAIIWGSTFIIIQDATLELSTNFIISCRFTIGFLFLAVVFYKKFRLINKSYFLWTALLGATFFLSYYLQTTGLALGVAPGKCAFLTAVYIAIVPFFHWIINHKSPNRYNIIAAFLCVTGIGFLSLNGDLKIKSGELITLLGGVACAFNLVLSAKLVKDKDPILITILQFGYVAVYAWILVILQGGFPKSVGTGNVIGVVYLGLAATGICLLFQTVSMKYVSPSSGALILSLESVFSILFSLLLGRERLTIKVTIGLVFIFTAILISETKLSFIKGSNKLIEKQIND